MIDAAEMRQDRIDCGIFKGAEKFGVGQRGGGKALVAGMDPVFDEACQQCAGLDVGVRDLMLALGCRLVGRGELTGGWVSQLQADLRGNATVHE